MGEQLTAILGYLSTRSDYAIVGDNAFASYLGGAEGFHAEFEVICASDVSFEGVSAVESPLVSLSNEAIIRDSQTIFIDDDSIQVAKPEYLIAMDLAFGERHGRDSYRLIKKLKQKIEFEDIRCLWKVLDNYDDLYAKLTQAFYELARD